MSKKKQAQPQAAVQTTQTLWRQLGALPTEAPALSGEEQRALYLQAMKKAGLSAVRPAAQKPKRTLRRRWALGTAAALAVLSVGGLLVYGTGGFVFGTKTGTDAADAVPQTALTSGMDTAASSQEMKLFAAADSTAALGGAEQAPQIPAEADGSRSGRWTAAGRQYTLASADAAEEAFAEVCAAVQACNGDLVKS